MWFSETLKEKKVSDLSLNYQIYSELKGLPQFVDTKRGLLNVLNGCLVRISEEGLLLTWCEKSSSMTGWSGGSTHNLVGADSLQKFLVAMQSQQCIP